MAAPRVLLVTSRFFLLGEIMAAFDRLGVAYRYLDTGGDEVDKDAYVSVISRSIAELRPDFVLTVNHLGVDHEGILTGLLSAADIPLASWFVDNPYLALALYDQPSAKRTAIFTWDADNLEPLRRSGFEQVFYLPLATDELRFTPAPKASLTHPWRARVSFVGNSMVIKTRKRLEYAEPSPALLAALPELARGFGAHPEWSVRAYLFAHHPELAGEFAALATPQRQLAYETAVIWESTRQYRRACLEQLMEFSPAIVGDPGWLETFPGGGCAGGEVRAGANGGASAVPADKGCPPRRWRRIPELAYYDELPNFYPLSAINFNCTSLQMKGAVNQRVFDVPACGAFLLTDHRAQMERLFEPGREVVCYNQPEEIPDLVRHYLAHPQERRAVAQAARQRVLAEHTYTTRMGQLLTLMRQTFG